MTELPGLNSGFADAADSTGLLLWQVTNRWQAAQRAALKPYGLTHVQFVLLASLTWLGSHSDEPITPITQQRLATHAATDPMMTSQVLRTLQGKGLVRRDADPVDARARVLSVTVGGADLFNRAIVAVEDCDRDFFAALGSGRVAFTRRLRVLAEW